MKFKDLRMRAGLTEKQLVIEDGRTSLKTVSYIEGGRSVTREVVKRLLYVLNGHLGTSYTPDDLDDVKLLE